MVHPTLFLIGDSISIQYGTYLKQYLSHRAELARKRGEAEALNDLDIPAGKTTWISTTPVDEELHNERQESFARYEKDLEECNRIADEVMERRGIATIDLTGFTSSLGLEQDYPHVKDEADGNLR